jgi:hypothetical protein
MPATPQHWAALVEPVLNRQFFYVGFGGEGRRQSLLDRLFNIQTSQYAEEKTMSLGGFSTQGWNFEDSGRVQYDERAKGYEKTFAHHEFAKGFIVTRRLMDDNRLSTVFRDARELGDSAFRMREKAGANVFAQGFSNATTATLDQYGTDAVGPDGVALLSDAHPAPPGAGGSTQSNEGTLALTAANLGTVRAAMMSFKDYQGDLLNVMPDTLLVPPELEDTALTIVRSQQDPTSANNAINPQAGRFQVIVWHYLADSNAWFLIDSSLMRQHLHWFDRIPLEFGREEDFDTFQAKFRAYQRFSLGWSDWRFIYGENPS